MKRRGSSPPGFGSGGSDAEVEVDLAREALFPRIQKPCLRLRQHFRERHKTAVEPNRIAMKILTLALIFGLMTATVSAQSIRKQAVDDATYSETSDKSEPATAGNGTSGFRTEKKHERLHPVVAFREPWMVLHIVVDHFISEQLDIAAAKDRPDLEPTGPLSDSTLHLNPQSHVKFFTDPDNTDTSGRPRETRPEPLTEIDFHLGKAPPIKW